MARSVDLWVGLLLLVLLHPGVPAVHAAGGSGLARLCPHTLPPPTLVDDPKPDVASDEPSDRSDWPSPPNVGDALEWDQCTGEEDHVRQLVLPVRPARCSPSQQTAAAASTLPPSLVADMLLIGPASSQSGFSSSYGSRPLIWKSLLPSFQFVPSASCQSPGNQILPPPPPPRPCSPANSSLSSQLSTLLSFLNSP